MIEAVNSVLANSSYTRAPAEQVSVATSFAANPDRVQQAPTQAPYLSLYIKVDTNFDRAVLQIRDVDTGDVVRQIPSESQLEAYRRAQSSNAARPAKADEKNPVTYEAQSQTGSVSVKETKTTQTQKSSASIPTTTSTSAPQQAKISAPQPEEQFQVEQASTSAPAHTSVDTTA